MIVRGPRPQGNFYLLDKGISEDPRLSWAARGLLVFLLGKPDHWQVSPASLVNETARSGSPLGRDGVYGLLTQLREAGYITRTQQRSADGVMGPVSYLVCEAPLPAKPDAAPLPGLPVTAAPHPVKPTQASIDSKQGLTAQQGLTSSARVKFDIEAGKFTGLDAEQLQRWATAFPSISVPTEIERACCWLICNPSKRPKANALSFLNSWLSRAYKPAGNPDTRAGRAEAFSAGLYSTPPAANHHQGASNVVDVEAREVH